jgi:transketolase C-terminal domain/subunit
VVAVVVVLLTTGSDKPTAGDSVGGGPAPAGSSSPGSSTKVDRKATQVAVLNGTTQTGLARGVGNKLQDRGFTILSVGDNADQQIAATTVSYAAGNELAARVIARIVGVTGTAVKPIDTNTATAVAPEASVVVTVGNDRSSTG